MCMSIYVCINTYVCMYINICKYTYIIQESMIICFVNKAGNVYIFRHSQIIRSFK